MPIKLSGGQRTRTHRSNPRAGLSTIAKKTTVELPDPNEPPRSLEIDLSKANVIEVKPSVSDTDDSSSTPGDQPEELKARVVAAELAALRSAQRRLSEGMEEVKADCSGHTVGRNGSCGRSGVVSRRYTASCQDALRRARAQIPRARDALARLRSKGRKSGMTPGEMRRFMKRQGIEALGLELSRTDAYVEALQRGAGN